MEEGGEAIADEGFAACGIVGHASEDGFLDVAGLDDLQGGVFNGGVPSGEAVTEAEVSVEEVAAGSQDAGDFAEEGGEVGVAMRGFDVDDGIEGGVGEGEFLGVALDELELGEGVALLTELDAGGVEVETGVTCRFHGAGDPGSAAAVAATDFEDLFADEIDLRGNVMVELDAGAVGFVGGIELEADGGIGFEGVVEEEDFLTAQFAGEVRIPQLPDGFADGGDGEQAFQERHERSELGNHVVGAGAYLAGAAFQTLRSSKDPSLPATPSSILDLVAWAMPEDLR